MLPHPDIDLFVRTAQLQEWRRFAAHQRLAETAQRGTLPRCTATRDAPRVSGSWLFRLPRLAHALGKRVGARSKALPA